MYIEHDIDEDEFVIEQDTNEMWLTRIEAEELLVNLAAYLGKEIIEISPST